MKNTKNTLLSIAIIAALPFTANADYTYNYVNAPARVGYNGTVNITNGPGPYQTATIGEHDDEHIATTAYVKGAYNDAIAAVNRVISDTSDKQDQLFLGDDPTDTITPFVVGSEHIEDMVESDYFQGIPTMSDNEYEEYMSNVLENTMQSVMGGSYGGPGFEDKTLITFKGALDLVHKMTKDSANNLVDSIHNMSIQVADKQPLLTTTVNNQSQNINTTVAQTVNTTTPSATTLVSEAAVAGAMNNYATTTTLNSKRVEIYTTWGVDDGTATALVPFATAQ